MNAFTLTLAAVALTLGSGAAFANTQDARSPIGVERNGVDAVGAASPFDNRGSAQTGLFGPKSRPTIFGHDAESSRYVSSGETAKVWGYPLDR